jgi:phage terminase large subunit
VPVVTLPFKPRPWQIPLIEDEAREIVAVVHRRAGKSAGLMWRGIKRGLMISRRRPPPRIIHTLPFQVQWDRTGLWDRLAEAGRAIPGAKVMISDRRIILPGGGVYQAGGMDKPDSWRGGYADEVILDEYDDTQAEGQTTAILPMLADYGGVLVMSGTPKGFGRLKAAYDAAGTNPNASRYLLPYQATNTLSDDAIADMRAKMTPEEFAQEFECSFDAPNSGAYYAALMQTAEAEGRITDVPHDPKLPVWTAWDLGRRNAMVVWCLQTSRGGGRRVIECISATGGDLPFFVRELRARPYQFERHFLPHDVEVTELGNGQSRRETLTSLGLRNIVNVPSYPGAVHDGINAVKMMIPKCTFDRAKTAEGVKALWNYRRAWSEQGQTFQANPVHDWTSDYADAFRMAAMGGREPRELKASDPYARKPPKSSTNWMAA